MNTYKNFIAIAGLSALLAPTSYAVLLAGQGFENETTPGLGYNDASDVAHALADTSTANVVSDGIGTELGFTVSYAPAAGRQGDFINEPIGVASASQIPLVVAGWSGSFSDGSTNGYTIGDTDGLITFELETIDLTLSENVVFTFDLQFAATTWELTDTTLITLTTDAGTTNLVNLFDGGGADNALDLGTALDFAGNALTEGAWSTISLAIPDSATFATFSVAHNTNSDGEAVIFDNIQFNGDLTVVPEPSSALLLLGSSALLFRRRRK